MKKIIFLILISLSLKINFVLAYSSDPKLFVEELVNEAINKLSDKTVSDEEKSSFIEISHKKSLVPNNKASSDALINGSGKKTLLILKKIIEIQNV